MNNIFDGFKITIFELVGYVLPGLLSELVVYLLFFSAGLKGFNTYLPIFLLLSYPMGQMLHTLSNLLDFDLNSACWQIYHLFKEKDEKGHGIKDPKSFLGKIAVQLRAHIEKSTPTGMLNDTDKILISKLKLGDLSKFDIFFVKESILAESSNIATNFEHLHYQKIFNKSVAFIFVCLALFFPLSSTVGVNEIIFSQSKSIDIQEYLLLLTVSSGVLYKIFFERAKFFKSYRDKIMSSAVRIYLENNFKEELSKSEK